MRTQRLTQVRGVIHRARYGQANETRRPDCGRQPSTAPTCSTSHCRLGPAAAILRFDCAALDAREGRRFAGHRWPTRPRRPYLRRPWTPASRGAGRLGGGATARRQCPATTFFLVDPLDGTREFLAGRRRIHRQCRAGARRPAGGRRDRGAGAGPDLARRAGRRRAAVTVAEGTPPERDDDPDARLGRARPCRAGQPLTFGPGQRRISSRAARRSNAMPAARR